MIKPTLLDFRGSSISSKTELCVDNDKALMISKIITLKFTDGRESHLEKN